MILISVQLTFSSFSICDVSNFMLKSLLLSFLEVVDVVVVVVEVLVVVPVVVFVVFDGLQNFQKKITMLHIVSRTGGSEKV